MHSIPPSDQDLFNRTHREYRQLAKTVLRWLYELETGMVVYNPVPQCMGWLIFEPDLLNYHLDIKRVMEREMTPVECDLLRLVHRDGYSHKEAIAAVHGDVDRADRTMALLEERAGRIFERHGVSNIVGYVGRENFGCLQ